MSSEFSIMQQESSNFSSFFWWKKRITPELAAELLGLNTANYRKLKKKKVYEYAELMKKGMWVRNGDTITIANQKLPSGETRPVVTNGQHRLWAIIESGIPQYFNIESGLEYEISYSQDTQSVRLLSDMLGNMGIDHSKQLSRVLKLLYSHLVWDNLSTYIGSSPYISNSEIERLLDSLGEEEIEKLIQCFKWSETFKEKAMNKNQLTAFKYLFERFGEPKEKIEDFFYKLKTRENLSAESIILKIRDAIQEVSDKADSKGKTSSYKKAALLVKGLNYYLEGKTPQKFYFTYSTKIDKKKSNDDFPKVPGAGYYMSLK